MIHVTRDPVELDAGRGITLRQLGLYPENPLYMNFQVLRNGTQVGRVILNEGLGSAPGKPITEVAFEIDEEFSGKGYATRAVSRLVQYVFGETNVPEIYALVKGNNDASKKVLERARFSVVENKSTKNNLYFSRSRQ